MKIKIVVILLIIGLVAGFLLLKKDNTTPGQTATETTKTQTPTDDVSVIRQFMDKTGLELSSVGTDLPTQYFRVGKVTKVGTGENMDKVDGWVRQVNVYDQKDLINGTCSVYEYNLDSRNHKLTAVVIRGLKPSEIEDYKAKGVTCSSNTNDSQKLTKSSAETVAMNYLKRGLPNFDQIKNQLVYSEQNNGESHEWLWEDKTFTLPDGLSSRPYKYPMIRISVYGNREIQYWNTTSLFED